MTRITDSERIAACKVLGVCSAVDQFGNLQISTHPFTLVKGICGDKRFLPMTKYNDFEEYIDTKTIVTDCPDWRSSARDEMGEVVE
jgi:hypothetical protein